jgi:uncharacterized protein YndB with AHSA1/START domain
MEIKVKHRFSASAERVYDAWLDPEKAGKFLFVTGTGHMRRCEIDARVGGRFTIVEERNGEEVLHTGEYLELDRPKRIVFTLSVPKYSSDEGRVTVEIAARGTGSEVTLTQKLPDAQKEHGRRAADGWKGILELAAEIVVEGEPSCGTGLAQHASVPAHMAPMLTALADTLSTHRAMLVLSDPASAAEDEVYASLSQGFAGVAMLLGKTADQMASQRELPMGEHDMSKWGDAQMEAFQRFVFAQSRLLALLRVAAERDEKMLASMQPESS